MENTTVMGKITSTIVADECYSCSDVQEPPEDICATTVELTYRTVNHQPDGQQEFQWVSHDNATDRQRARAYLTRTARREKKLATEKKQQLGLQGHASRNARARPLAAAATTSLALKKSLVKPQRLVPRSIEVQTDSSSDTDVDSTISHLSENIPVAIRSAKADPFANYPVIVDLDTAALVDHFCCGIAPAAFKLDVRSTFRYVRSLCFEVALLDAAAFNVILCGAANDIARLRREEKSLQSLQYRRAAITLLNDRITNSKELLTPAVIAGAAMLAGNEIMDGTPQGFNIHMEGVIQMLNLIGGIDSLDTTSPKLSMLIRWFDFSGSCNYFSKSRFVQTPKATSSDPNKLPKAIIDALPKHYDLYDLVTTILTDLQKACSAIRHLEAEEDTQTGTTEFVETLNKELYALLPLPAKENNPGRRILIQRSHYLLALMCLSCLAAQSSWTIAADVLAFRMSKLPALKGCSWTSEIMELIPLIMGGSEEEADILIDRLQRLVVIGMGLRWDQWRVIEESFWELFLSNDACQGRLQNLWRLWKSECVS